MPRPPSATSILRNTKKKEKVAPSTPLAANFHIPNQSGHIKFTKNIKQIATEKINITSDDSNAFVVERANGSDIFKVDTTNDTVFTGLIRPRSDNVSNIGLSNRRYKDLHLKNDIIVDTTAFKVDGNAKRVGIGTDSPVKRLHLAAMNDEGIEMTYDAAGNYKHTIYNKFDSGNPANNYIKFKVCDSTVSGQASVMNIKGNGTVVVNGKFGVNIDPPQESIDAGFGKFKTKQSSVTEVYLENTGLRMKNIYTGGGWARGLLTYTNNANSNYFAFGGYGSGQNFAYAWLGTSWSGKWQCWAPGGLVGIGIPSTLLPDTRFHVCATVNGAPSLTADTNNIIKMENYSTGIELVMGSYGATPYAAWLQTKKSTNDGTIWPLVLNPIGGRIGIGTNAPNVSAALDVTSTVGAFMPPRMTTVQRNALTAANGMIIYNTTTNAFNFYENGAWVTGSGLV